MTNIKAVILAGGSGSRLWPMSRATHPKQFLALNGEETMFQSTLNRLSGLNIKSFTTLCNEEHRFFVAEQMRQIGKVGSIILEPVSRNTAPSLALAALLSDKDDLLLVLAADHIIENTEAFINNVEKAISLAESGKFVTFGIVTETPQTGYGYIKKGQMIEAGFSVSKFVEKPSIELARQFVNSGDYYCNSGIFLVKASVYLEELLKFNPKIYNSCQSALVKVQSDLDFIRINKESFFECPNTSIDYAVMEKTKNAVVIPMDVGWSDIGSWSSLWNLSKKDYNGNATHGDVVLHSSHNSYVRTDGILVAVIGLDDIVLVATKDVIMVSHKDSVENVKKITQSLEVDGRTEWKLNREVYRPWGKFDSIDKGERYQVKRITVKPGAKLSLQMHHHRAEHWIVVSGTARVSKANEIFRKING